LSANYILCKRICVKIARLVLFSLH